MNARTLVVAALALVGAIVAFMLVRSMLSSAQQQAVAEAQPVEQTSQVLVSARPLTTGTILQFEDMVWMDWPDKARAETFVVKGRGTIEEHVGKVVRLSFGDKEPISISKIVTKGQRGFLAAMLNPGMRAVSVNITIQSGIAGLLMPGDRVDVVLIHKVVDMNTVQHNVSETVLQNVRVLGVDQKTADDNIIGKPGKTVTLEVTPKMAEKMAMLIKLGSLHLSLRPLPRNAEALANDLEAMPVDSLSTVTWDNEVSALLEPNKDKHEVVVRRGANAVVRDFEAKSEEKDQ